MIAHDDGLASDQSWIGPWNGYSTATSDAEILSHTKLSLSIGRQTPLTVAGLL